MLAELSRCSTERLDAWIAMIPYDAKVDVLRRLQLMRSRLIETLLFKLEFFFHIPFRALGIFWAECGGVLSVFLFWWMSPRLLWRLRPPLARVVARVFFGVGLLLGV